MVYLITGNATPCLHSQGWDRSFFFRRNSKRGKCNFGVPHRQKGKGWDTGVQVELYLQTSHRPYRTLSLCKQRASISLARKGKIFFSCLKTLNGSKVKMSPTDVWGWVSQWNDTLPGQSTQAELALYKVSPCLQFLTSFYVLLSMSGWANSSIYLRKVLNINQRK